VNNAERASQLTLKELKSLVYNKVAPNGMRIVRLEYSYVCNFRCKHCCIRDYQGKSHRRAFTIADVKHLADQADAMGFGQFVISGGEPMMYPDFDDIVNAIGVDRFWITTDSNGWYMDEARALHLKTIGVDKVQLSIDSLDTGEHDEFRQKKGAWERAHKAIDYIQWAGLNVIIQTVVDKRRVHSQELIDFIEYFNGLGVHVYIGYAKPIGAWKGHELITNDDIAYIENLHNRYNVSTHLTPSYEYEGGCIAMKRMINVTKWGDVNPCPFMQAWSIGNVFDEPLADIVARGEKRFEGRHDTCFVATIPQFVEKNREE